LLRVLVEVAVTMVLVLAPAAFEFSLHRLLEHPVLL
jgi:hypothetical protein